MEKFRQNYRKYLADLFLYTSGLGEIKFRSNLDLIPHSQHAKCDE